MGLSDKLKQITEKAKESAVEHREQISGAVETVGVVADKRTRGRYSDKIAKAASKTEAAVDRFAGQPADEAAAGTATPGQPADEPAGGTTTPPPTATPEPASGPTPASSAEETPPS
jgi:hypothetical protein